MSALAGAPTPQVAKNDLPEEVPWVPRMDAIRKAQLAEVDALESVVGALASKQQSAITKLRRQVDTIMAWKSQIGIRDTRAATRHEMANAANGAKEAEYSSKTNASGASTLIPEVGALTDVANQRVVDHPSLVIPRYEGWGEMSAGTLENAQAPPNEEVEFLMHRVAVLERDLVKLQGMWDMNKGQRVIEVWMSILNRKSYKPSHIDDPVECAVITLQNWWKDMLVNKLNWSISSKSTVSSRQGSTIQCQLPGSEEKKSLEESGNLRNRTVRQNITVIAMIGTTKQSSRTTDDQVSTHESNYSLDSSSHEEAYSTWDEAPCAEIKQHQNEDARGTILAAPSESDNAESGQDSADDAATASSRTKKAVADDIPCFDEEMKQQVDSKTHVVDRNIVKAIEVTHGTLPKETPWKHPASVVNTPTERSDRCMSSASSHYRDHRVHHHHHHKDHKDHKAHESSGGVQGMFDGALKGNPVLMITSMAMQLQSQETELENLQNQVANLAATHKPQALRDQQRDVNNSCARPRLVDTAMDHEEQAEPEQRHPDPKVRMRMDEDFSEMGRRLGELQRELEIVRERAEDREKRTQLSLEELEALIAAKEEDSSQRLQEQAQENAQAVDKLLARLGTNADDEKQRVVCEALVELKLELRSLYSSLAAISGNEISATQLRSMEGIRHLLASFSERTRMLEEEIGDPAALAKNIVANNVSARRFADSATDLGTTLFAFIKAQVLQARRARDGSAAAAAKVHRRASSAAAATAVVAANIAGAEGTSVSAAGDFDGAEDRNGGGEGLGNKVVDKTVTGASPQAWAKLGYLMYTRDRTSEKMPFPAGMVILLKALSEVLNHCVGTGDLAIRLSVTLEDL
ncbi:unnamed protein product, partial [Hapterophycus canaliculatus]